MPIVNVPSSSTKTTHEINLLDTLVDDDTAINSQLISEGSGEKQT
jgi:hypothetical protein